MKTFTTPSFEDLTIQLAEYDVDFNLLNQKMTTLTEAVVLPADHVDVFQQAREISDMMDAAKRGLGIANKLTDPEMKRKHRSMVMSNLNKIGGRMRTLARRIDDFWETWRRKS